MKKLLLTCLCLIFLATACVSEPDNDLPVVDPSLDGENYEIGKVDYNPNPQYTAEEQQALVSGHNQFAFELYKLLAKTNENLVYSPYSLYQALVMVYAGSAEQTASEFEQVLHLPSTNPKVHALMNGLTLALQTRNEKLPTDEQAVLQVANAVWVKKDVELLQSYLDTLSENYAAGLRSLDFADAKQAAALVNRWAAENTQDKITQIATEDMFNENVALALTNAVYFKGSWALPFDEHATSNEPFTKLDGSTLSVATMHASENYMAAKDDIFQVLRLPYTGSSIVMDLIMPLEGDWQSFIQNLNDNELQNLALKMDWIKVSLSLPKFKIETPEIDMIDSMKGLGLVDVFTADANLSGINGEEDLYVSTLVQKAYIDVNEAGTEAAAVTIAVVMEKGIMSTEPVEMRFDHPFLFVIRDTKTGTILFIGQVMQP